MGKHSQVMHATENGQFVHRSIPVAVCAVVRVPPPGARLHGSFLLATAVGAVLVAAVAAAAVVVVLLLLFC